MAYSAKLLNSALAHSIRCYRFERQGIITDITEFLSNCASMMQAILEMNHDFMKSFKFWLCAEVEFVKSDDDSERDTFHFPVHLCTVLESFEIPELLQSTFLELINCVDTFERRGSNWIVLSIHHVDMHCVIYQPLKGSSYVPLPQHIQHKNAVVNIQNLNDSQCFKWCILASIHQVAVHPERVSHYRAFTNELNFSGIAFPMQLDKIDRFCKLNQDISVNVFSCDGPIRAVRVSKSRREHHVNLLFFQGHFALIRHFDRLMGDQNLHQHRKHFCDMCLIPFYTPDRLAAHGDSCRAPEFSRIEMPDHEVLKFRNTKRMIRKTVVVYADFECLLEPIASCTPPSQRSYTEKYQKHVPCAFGALKVTSCCNHHLTFGDYKNIVGPDCVSKFLDYVIQIAENLRAETNIFQTHNLSEQEENNFRLATECCICKLTLNAEDRVRDHCHVCGKFRGAAHGACNSELQTENELIVMFHNLRRYDGHFLIRAIGDLCALRGNSNMRINCIAKATEDYISFTLSRTSAKRSRGATAGKPGFKIKFLDSCQFLLSSLDALANGLPRDEFVALERFFPVHHDLLKRKGVFAYDYLDSWAKLDATVPPNRDSFYNQLTSSPISDADYLHMLNVWRTLQISSFGEYMRLYLKTEILILCDIFENFRRFALNTFELDPCHYHTLPSFSWDACLKLTRAELELLSDIDMFTLYESGIKGGVSVAPTRYAEANNPYLPDHDPSAETSYLAYWDENNLYGGAMWDKHAVGGFAWLTEDEIKWLFINILNFDFEADTGMVLVVDLQYPKLLHSSHNCFPLAPERVKIEEDMLSPYCRELLGATKHVASEKLAPNLWDKKEYIVDARMLQFLILHGLNLLKIHKGIKFSQAAWMRPYIEFNTNQRRSATSKLQKNFFKLMNNSVYGKTMENPRKFIDFELVTSRKRLLKVTKKPEFVKATIFSENLVGCLKRRPVIQLNKPIYVGFSVLELSKKVMYRFHYDVIRPRYGDNAIICMSDTDSFLYHIKTEDLYKDMLDMIHEFDTSEYPDGHFLKSDVNKAVLNKMKDETKGKPIKKFVGLKPKMYSYVVGDNEFKRAKGVKRDVVEKVIRHEDYVASVTNNITRYDDMRMIRSYLHELYTIKLHKKSLSSFDDKRYLLDDGVHSLAYGHRDIPEGAAGAYEARSLNPQGL